MEKVIDTTGMKKLDGQMLKRNFGLNSTDYEGVSIILLNQVSMPRKS